MSLHLYDSVLKQKVKFVSQEENKAKVYVCGPTVYDDAHLGHARSSISFDLLRRTLECNGYNVTFVKNFTDIDDKIIKKIDESTSSIDQIEQNVEKYLQDIEFPKDEDLLIESLEELMSSSIKLKQLKTKLKLL